MMARADRLYNLAGCFLSFVAVFSISIYFFIFFVLKTIFYNVNLNIKFISSRRRVISCVQSSATVVPGENKTILLQTCLFLWSSSHLGLICQSSPALMLSLIQGCEMQMTDLRLLTSRKKLIFNEKPTPLKYELATIPACNFRSLLASRDPQIDRVLDKARRFQQSH